MEAFIGGESSPVEVASILIALAAKGTSGPELAAFARVLRENGAHIPTTQPTLVDTCGTGGGIPSFNISTAAALVAAAAGAKVAKHGNRAVTSKCGSADVLEAFGVKLDVPPEKSAALLESVGVAFLFAPSHHPALRHVGPVRKELGVRTVFNQLGPLANPAGAKRQLVGVFDRSLLVPMGEALCELGAERALIVHSDDGLDEISPCAPASAARIENGSIKMVWLQPFDFGLEPIEPSALVPGDTTAEAADIVREAISDANSPRAAAILPSVGATLWLAGVAEDFREGTERARAAIESGAAEKVLAALVEESNA